MAMRRSASEPISQMASAIMSAAKATGSAWKLPPESALAVVRRRSADCRRRRWPRSPASPRPGAARRGRAHHLRLAAQAIRILHALVADQMRGADADCLPSGRATQRRVSIWPRCRRSGWMRGSNGASEPFAASVDSAPVTSADCEQRSDLEQAGQRIGGRELRAVEQGQAFLGAERRAAAARPAQRLARPARRAVRRRPRPTPIIAAAMCASGARSPEAPTEPWHGTTGIRSRGEHRLQQSPRVSGRTPEAPCARLASFSASISRTIGSGTARRRRPRATARCCAAAAPGRPASMRTLASLPKPVLMP